MILLAAVVGAYAGGYLTRAWVGGALLGMLGAGVIWSNALAYRDVNLAPAEQLTELEEVGEAIAGEGPTLMTEYSPYGARHFLRDAEPESVSDLRRHELPLLDGGPVRKGFSADTDQLDPGAIYRYRSLVLRRSPTSSRPPAAYELAWSGDFYDVWQRAPAPMGAPARLPLGSRRDPAAKPRCRDVRRLAARGSALAAATRPGPLVVSASAEGAVRIQRPGEYEVWLEGSVRPRVEALIDGQPVGEVRHELNNHGQFVSFGSTVLRAGTHLVELRSSGADLSPGSAGGPPAGPLVLSRGDARDSRVVEVPAAVAEERLCGREWDWIEAG